MVLQAKTNISLSTLLKAKRPLVMGILNITPDSFSDGNRYLLQQDALAHARLMVEQGADIIDIGAESTRPGAVAISEQEELDRAMPVIEQLRNELPVALSIDTSKPMVMHAAVEAGVDMINDINALQAEGAVMQAARLQVPVCLMHKQGTPATMQQAPQYEAVVSEVIAFLRERVGCCEQAGIAREQIIIDPGFGFGKTVAHNIALLKNLSALQCLDLPVLVGLSRKAMFGELLNKPVNERANASVIAMTLAVLKGARIVRVHDVAPSVEAIRLLTALNNLEVKNV